METWPKTKITSAGNNNIRVALGDPIGSHDHDRVVTRMDAVGDPLGWTVAVYDQDEALRMQFVATWVAWEGALIGDSDVRYS